MGLNRRKLIKYIKSFNLDNLSDYELTMIDNILDKHTNSNELNM